MSAAAEAEPNSAVDPTKEEVESRVSEKGIRKTDSLDVDVEVMERVEIDKLPEDHPARQFGKYKLLRRIAQGGMAELFLAEQAGPNGFSKRVVVKRILKRHALDAEFSRMFIREAQVAAQLDHPNIVSVFDFGEEKDGLFIAMEYVQGPSLSRMLRRLKLDGEVAWKLASAIGLQICRGLQATHSLKSASGKTYGLVHRDVSPGNILLSKSGAAKLTDFGIVKITEQPVADHEEATKIGVIKGKVGYMSPEQARTQPVDRRSDLFSLGVVLYEIALGRRLFKRKDDVQSILAIVSGDVPPPTSLDPQFPPELEAIIGKAIRLDPDERYASADELATALERFRQRHGWGSPERDVVDALRAAEGRGPVGRMPAVNPDTTSSFTLGGSASWTTGVRVKEAEQRASMANWLLIGAGVAATAAFWWMVLQ